MNVVKNQVRTLVCAEAMAATLNHGTLHSSHEAWAVLKEEVDEVEEELRYMMNNMERLWGIVRADRSISHCITLGLLRESTIRLACEAIQCAAVCKRIAEMEGKSCENH